MICSDSIIRKNNWHMKQEEKNKVNTNEMGVAIGVDNEVIEKVRSGEITGTAGTGTGERFAQGKSWTKKR